MTTFDTAYVRDQFPPLKDGWVFVENAGGKIEVESKLGLGSRFVLTFPVSANA